MNEIKIGDTVIIKVIIKSIIDDETGRSYRAIPVGASQWETNFTLRPKSIIEKIPSPKEIIKY